MEHVNDTCFNTLFMYWQSFLFPFSYTIRLVRFHFVNSFAFSFLVHHSTPLSLPVPPTMTATKNTSQNPFSTASILSMSRPPPSSCIVPSLHGSLLPEKDHPAVIKITHIWWNFTIHKALSPELRCLIFTVTQNGKARQVSLTPVSNEKNWGSAGPSDLLRILQRGDRATEPQDTLSSLQTPCSLSLMRLHLPHYWLLRQLARRPQHTCPYVPALWLSATSIHGRE